MKLRLWQANLVLLGFGIIRNNLEVIFGIGDGGGVWYSLRPDVILIMAVFPGFLCFFSFLLFVEVGRLAGLRFKQWPLLKMLFWVQLVHLLVPLGDWLGKLIGAPLSYQVVSEQFRMDGVFEPVLGMTLGIIIAWVVAFIVFVRSWLTGKIIEGEPRGQVLPVAFMLICVGLILYWPIYHLYPLSLTAFTWLTGGALSKWYGYGLFFLLFWLVGLRYASRRQVWPKAL